MSDEGLSKRARQKQRRSLKLDEQRRQAAKARRKRLLTLGLAVLIVLALIGLAIAQRVSQRNADLAQQQQATAKLAELGCDAGAPQEDAGAGHLETAQAQLVASPPDTLYPDRPASSGQHYPAWVKTGFYDVQIDERLLVHNLEHGYVVAYYDGGAEPEQVEALETYAGNAIAGDYPKLIVAPWDGDLQGEANFSWVSWTVRQSCRDFDQTVFEVFQKDHHSGAGTAPEKTIPAHLEEGNGTLDPKGEDLLLPPLGQTAAPNDPPPSENASERATDGPTASDDSQDGATDATETAS